MCTLKFVSFNFNFTEHGLSAQPELLRSKIFRVFGEASFPQGERYALVYMVLQLHV